MKKIVALVLAMVMVLGLATTAFAFEDAVKSYGGKYAEATDSVAATATNVTVEYYAAEAPEYDKKGDLKEEGVIAHYVVIGAGDMDGAYVKVNTVNDADVVIYNDAAMKKTFLNLKAIESPLYVGTGKAFSNFGEECGQSAYADYDKKLDYYTCDGVYYEESETYTGTQLLVGTELVYVTAFEPALVPHVAAVTIEDGKVIAVACSECGEPAVYVANFKSIPDPTKVQWDGNDEDGYWYWPAKAAAPAEDTTVESPKTFDAGIAMYVGMSVMAAAGSAVVLKKKD